MSCTLPPSGWRPRTDHPPSPPSLGGKGGAGSASGGPNGSSPSPYAMIRRVPQVSLGEGRGSPTLRSVGARGRPATRQRRGGSALPPSLRGRAHRRGPRRCPCAAGEREWRAFARGSRTRCPRLPSRRPSGPRAGWGLSGSALRVRGAGVPPRRSRYRSVLAKDAERVPALDAGAVVSGEIQRFEGADHLLHVAQAKWIIAAEHHLACADGL